MRAAQIPRRPILAILLLFLGSFAAAQDSPRPIYFHWVDTPDPLTTLANTPNIHDLPVENGKFQEMLQTLRNQQAGAAAQGAGLGQAAYFARLQKDRLQGVALWTISHRAAKPVLLPLQPCGLAVGPAVWAPPQESQPAPPQEAKVGWEPSRRLAILVERSGQVRTTWSLQGNRDPVGAVHFELRLPACPINRLVLETPADFRPQIQQAEVRRLPQPPPNWPRLLTEPEDAASESPAYWEIELGGRAVHALRLAPPASASKRRPVLQSLLQYRFLTHGVDLQARWLLDAQLAPLETLPLEVDAGLELARAALESQGGERPLNWTSLTGGQGGKRRYLLELPETLDGADHVIRLAAVGPLTEHRLWKLPTIQADPQAVFWRSGETVLEIPRPLRLQQLQLSGGRQIESTPLPAAEDGSAVRLQMSRRDASVSAVLERTPQRVEVRSGITVKLGAEDVQAVARAEFVFHGPPSFELPLEMLDSWNFSSLETDPPNVVDRWDWAESPVAGRRQLRLLLRRAPPQGRAGEKRLRVVLRMWRRPEATIRGEVLRPLRFPQADWKRGLISLTADPSRQIRLRQAAAVERLDPRGLTDADAALIETTPGAVALVDSPEVADLWASFTPGPPSFSAVSTTEIEARRQVLRRVHRFRCSPNSSSLSELTVRFHQSGPKLDWKLRLGDGEETNLRARKSVELGGETWKLSFPQSLDKPFEVVASGRLDPAAPIPLPWLPAAAAQTGLLTLLSASGESLECLSPDLKNAAAPPPPPDRYSEIQAHYRYDSAPQAEAVIIRRGDGDDDDGDGEEEKPPAAWAWSLHVDSRFSQHGPAVHTAVYQLENRGRQRLTLRLPETAKPRQLLLDGREIPLASASTVSFSPPRGVRFLEARLTYQTDSPNLGVWSRVAAPAAQADFPILEQTWKAWLPPGYASLSSAAHQNLSWPQRLLGLMRREPPQSPSSLEAGEVSSAPVAGWSAHVTTLPAPADRLQLTVYRIAWLEGFGWIALLTSIGCFSWLAGRRWSSAPVCLLLTAAAALMIPAPWHPIGAGLFLGAALAALLSLFRRGAAPGRAFLGLLLVLFPLLGSPPPMSAQPPANKVLANSYPVYRAVDEKTQQPTGYVYPHKVFYRILTQRAEAAKAAMQWGWLIRKARYQSRLDRDAEGGWTMDEFTASYQVEVFQPDAQIRLPLDRNQVDLQAVRLDRRVVAARWDQPQQALLVDVGEPGLKTLELTFLPQLRITAAGAEVKIQAPPVADSEWIVNAPAGETGQGEFPTALGGASYDAQSQSWNVRLGPASELRAIWSEVGRSAPLVRAEELLRLETRNGYRLVRGQFRFSSPRPIRQVRLKAAADWQLQQLRADSLLIRHSTLRQEAGKTIFLEFDPNRPGELIEETDKPEAPADTNIAPPVGAPAAEPPPAEPPAAEPPPAEPPPAEPPAAEPPAAEPPLAEPPAGDAAVVGRKAGEEGYQTTVEALFLWKGDAKATLTAPAISAEADEITRRWLAVSLEPGLRFRDPVESTISPVEFAAAWGPVGDPPSLAFDRRENAAALSLAIEPRRRSMSARQTADYGWERETVKLHYQAEVQIEDGYLFQYQLRLPGSSADPPLQIASVAVHNDPAQPPVASQWSFNASQRDLIVRLNQPASGRQTLKIEAVWTPLEPQGCWRPPILFLPTAKSGPYEIRLHQHVSRSLKIDQLRGFIEQKSEPLGRTMEGDSPIAFSRLAAVLQADLKTPPAARSLRVCWEKNAAEVKGEFTIELSPGESGWRAAVQYDLRVKGRLDALRLSLPLSWTPENLDPQLRPRWRTIPGRDRRYLILRPPTPIQGDYRLRLEGPLEMSEPIRCPDIRPEGLSGVARYIRVPVNDQPSQPPRKWEPSGLQKTDPNDTEKPPLTQRYQIVRKNFSLTLRPQSGRQGRPQTHLADIQGVVSPEGWCRGVAAFELDPAGISHCVLQLPQEYRLLHAAAGGLPALPEPLGKRRWRLRLGPQEEPQLVEILFVGQLQKNASGDWRAPHPRLENMAARRTIWSWRVDHGVLRRRESAGLWEREAARMESAATLLEQVRGSVSPGDVGRESELWKRRWLEARKRLGDVSEETLSAAEKRQWEQWKVFQQKWFDSPLSSSATTRDWSQIWRQKYSGEAASYGVTKNPDEEAVLSLEAPLQQRDRLQRLACGALFTLLAVLGWRLRRETIGEALRRRAAWAAIFAGVVWLLFLTPGEFGWLWIVGGVIGGGLGYWRGREK